MDKIKSIVIGFFSFMWISVIWTTAAMGTKEGGAGINGFLAFLSWALCVFLIIKGRAIVAALASTIIIIIISIPRLNIAGLGETFWEFYEPFVQVIALIVIIKFIINFISNF